MIALFRLSPDLTRVRFDLLKQNYYDQNGHDKNNTSSVITFVQFGQTDTNFTSVIVSI